MTEKALAPTPDEPTGDPPPRAPYRPAHAARSLPSDTAAVGPDPRRGLSRRDRRHVLVVVAATSAAAVAFATFGGTSPPSTSDTAATRSDAAVIICEDQARLGFQQPETVRFSAESWETNPDGTVEVRGAVSAVDLAGSAVSGAWSCTAELVEGYWTAHLSIDPTLA